MGFDTSTAGTFKENSEQAQLALMRWANGALESPYQHRHMLVEPSTVALPPRAVLEAQKLVFKPRVKVPADTDLFAGTSPLPMEDWYPADEKGSDSSSASSADETGQTGSGSNSSSARSADTTGSGTNSSSSSDS